MSTINAQDVKAVSLKVKPFWQYALQHYTGRDDTYFSVKLCYSAREFATPVMAARLFPFELEHTTYFELVNFSFDGLLPGYRQLHRLPYKPLTEWQKLYPFYPNANGGTYLIPLSEFELVHTQTISEPIPFEPAVVAAPEPVYAMSYDAPTFTEDAPAVYETGETEGSLEDMSMSNITLRDQYAITHSVPVSNIPWINRMIEFGNAHKRDQEVLTAKAIQEFYLTTQRD